MSELPASLPKNPPPASGLRRVFSRAFAFVASFGLGVVVLLFLLLLTWLGTIRQVDNSLYDVQKKYFDSLFLLEEVGPIKIPLPGGMLLMGILFFNMLAGGIIRIRKNWRTFGVVIAHFSILVLLAAGVVSFLYKREGYLKINEGGRGNVFTSYTERVLEVTEVGGDGVVHVIHESDLADLSGAKTRAFFAKGLPFEFTVSNFQINCDVESAGMRPPHPGVPVVDGFYLSPRLPAMQAEQNLAGCQIAVKTPDGAEQKALLWQFAVAPWTWRTPDGRVFIFRLNRQSWELPFDVHLEKFTHEVHPGTNKPKVYASDVIKRQDGIDQPVKIEMNKPLRDRGYTLFQASYNDRWRPGMPRTEMYSVFAVVKNPSDKWPIWGTIMAAVGIGIHFCMKLAQGINRASRKRAAASESGAPSPATP